MISVVNVSAYNDEAKADIYSVLSEKTEDSNLNLGGATPSPRLYILVFPGNPGGASFYSLFANTLFSRFASKGNVVQVVVVGHASHSSTSASPTLIHSLEDQLLYKTEFINSILASNDENRIALVGHSVGAWLALQGAARLTNNMQDRIVSIVGLFPTFINIHTTRRAHQLSFLFTYIGMSLLATLAFFLRLFFPKEFIKMVAAYILRGVKDVTDIAVKSSVSLVHERVALNACTMARDEMLTIQTLSDSAVRMGRLLGNSFHAYYGKNDGWNNEKDIETMETLFKSGNMVRCQEGHSHAFVLSTSSCIRVAEQAAEMIQKSPRFISENFLSRKNYHYNNRGDKKLIRNRRGSVKEMTR